SICKTAKNIAKPIIAEQILKYKIDSVEFETLTLGCLSPTFQVLYLTATSVLSWSFVPRFLKLMMQLSSQIR
ncbi:hypothetical protein S83_070156, partial [Arachis hypogaea]